MSDEPPASTEESGQEKPPFDVQKVMEQVHFAFRPHGTAWEGGHSTYAVRVAADGFSVTPYHYPQGKPEGVESVRPSQEQSARRMESLSQEQKYVEGAPVRFGAARVTREGLMLSSLKAQGRVKDSGILTLARSEVAEHFRNSKDGVEQSWSFEHKFGGTGDLEVRVPVESGRFIGETAQGLHFADGTTGLGVSYGHGTWVDADGHRTPVPARFEAGTIVLSVPEQVVEASAYPAVLDPIVSPEFGMDDPVNGPADQSQYSPAVAHNGTNFLVVWTDYRSGNYDIYGARVSGTGTVLDLSGIPVSTALNSQESPAVVSDGANFLVVWTDYRNGYPDIYGARVSSTGAVLDPSGIPISTASYFQEIPKVAYDGTNFLVVWQDYRSNTNYDVYGTRLSSTGTVLDISGIPISAAANDQLRPAVAHNGTNFLVVWQDYRSGAGFSDIYGARVSGAGAVLNTNGILISSAVNSQEYPAVAYNGADFLVVWQDYRSGTTYDIYGARVSGTGVVRNPSGIPISTASNDQRYPALSRDGTNCLVVWQDYRSYDIYGARVNSAGTVLDTSSILISTNGNSTYQPAVAHDGTNFLVVWFDYRGSAGYDIYGTRVSGTGMVLDTSNMAISLSSNAQYTPAVAHDGTNFLVVWQDYRSGYSRIYGALVGEDGTPLDPSGISISMSSNSQYAPAVAHDGANFLVVWQDYRGGTGYDIYGARVSSTGAVLDIDGIPISTNTTNQYNPAVAFNGVDFLIVWDEYHSSTEQDIYGVRVSSTGMVLDTSDILISSATSTQNTPSVAFNGVDFLVVWQDYRSGSSDIYGARVSSTGTVLDTSGIVISSAANGQYSPAVAYNGLYCLIVWQDTRSGSFDIYGTRMSSTGTVLDTSGISISSATNNQQSPAVAYDGSNFLVVWQDYRSGTGFSDIYGARVSETGTLLNTSGFVISAEAGAEVQPKVTSMGGERSLVVYRRTHVSASTNSERVLARIVESP